MAFVPTALVSFRLRTHESSTQNLFARRQRVFEAVKKPRSRISRRVTCDIDNKPPSSDVEVESRDGKDASESPIAKLRSEQLDAYFDADESMYQVRLANALSLAFKNFAVELRELQIGFRRFLGMRPPLRYTPPECLGFTLDNEAVTLREKTRESRDGRVQTSWFVRMFYDVTCKALDVFFDGRPVPRFWFLETVARMPYFSYSSCLHLLSTLGWYRSPTLMNMHHAEELNEAYHLAVMESLGGDKRWGVSMRPSFNDQTHLYS